MNNLHKRLYYNDSYLTRFEADVTERLVWDGRPAVVLTQTAFYPTSGGQPSDRGFLGGVAVVGVEVREADGEVVHILADELPADHVVGEIDWPRRFDHMQQHSGQHLLSAACEKLLGADTVSFHLGAESSTIDLDRAGLSRQELEPAEDWVNRAIWANHPLTARFVSAGEVAVLPLRHQPKVEGPIRLVEIEGCDLTPCGGTHVARCGEIGLLKIVRVEHRGEETRVEFLCGQRALADYRRKNAILLGLAAELTVGFEEVGMALARLQEELKASQRELRTLREHLLEAEAVALLGDAKPVGALRVVRAVLAERAPADLRALALRLSETSGVVALLASPGERTQLCFACAEGSGVDAAALLRAACELLGGKGGGQPRIAQGSAPAAAPSFVEQVLQQVTVALEESSL